MYMVLLATPIPYSCSATVSLLYFVRLVFGFGTLRLAVRSLSLSPPASARETVNHVGPARDTRVIL